MKAGLVTAAKIDKGLSSAGHVILVRLFFGTGKATIKPESDDALKNIAEYLMSHQTKKYLVVGHTDNMGDFESNLKLSTARAKAVMDALTHRYHIKAGMLQPYGIGFADPVSTNMTDEGRARNRRVELVAR